MTKRVTKYGAIVILIFMTLLTTGCVITTTFNIGHHIETNKTLDDAFLEQGYETHITGNKRK